MLTTLGANCTDIPDLKNKFFDKTTRKIQGFDREFEDCGIIQDVTYCGQSGGCHFSLPNLEKRINSGVYLWVAEGWDINSKPCCLENMFDIMRQKKSISEIDSSILYIGKAKRIGQRFRHYCHPGKRQPTNKKMNKVIAQITKHGEKIRIYFCETETYTEAGKIEKRLLGKILTFFNKQNNMW